MFTRLSHQGRRYGQMGSAFSAVFSLLQGGVQFVATNVFGIGVIPSFVVQKENRAFSTSQDNRSFVVGSR